MHVMVRPGKRAVAAFASVLAASALVFAACGGDGSNKDATSSTSTPTTAAGGATGTSGASGARGSTEGTRTGGAKAPAGGANKPSKKPATGGSSPGGSNTSAGGGSTNGSAPKDKNDSKSKKKPKSAAEPIGAPELATYYTQAKEVCKYLTLEGLAHEYEVPATPSAVAKAYSQKYPEGARKAVYKGCKAGVS